MLQAGLLTLTDRVYLAAVLRSGLGRDGKAISGQSIVYGQQPAGPTVDFSTQLITHCLRSGILKFHEPLNPSAAGFEYDLDNMPTKLSRWTPSYGVFELNLIDVVDPTQVVSLTCLPDDSAMDYDEITNDARNICRLVAEEECIAYLYERCEALQLEVQIGEIGRGQVRKALDWFSVGQVRSLIWRSTKDVLRYITEHHKSRERQKHLPAKFLLNFSERARANGWEIKPYSLPIDRSAIVSVVAHQLLKSGDKWDQIVIEPSADTPTTADV